jgi:hypothetical protein
MATKCLSSSPSRRSFARRISRCWAT